VISKYKSPASDCNFRAKYLLQQIKNEVTSQIQLHKILIIELECNVNDTTIGRALAITTLNLLFNSKKEIQLNVVILCSYESEWRICTFR